VTEPLPLSPLTARFSMEIDACIGILEAKLGEEFWRHMKPAEMLAPLIRQVGELAHALVDDHSPSGQLEALACIGALAAVMNERHRAVEDGKGKGGQP